MEDLSFFFGFIGNIISVLVFLSPIGTFWRIVKQKSTEEFTSLPYICTLLGSSLWTYYGIVKQGEFLVATVNGFGVLLETIYIILFLIFAPPKIKAKTGALVVLLNIGFPAAAILGTRLALAGEAQINALGLICAVLNIIMYGSPLAAMGTVVRTKSVEYMPFFLSFSLFLNGGVWTLYAFFVHDYFLAVPNGTGFLLGTTQLLLYAIYKTSKPSQSNILDELEDGSQHHPLIIPSSDT